MEHCGVLMCIPIVDSVSSKVINIEIGLLARNHKVEFIMVEHLYPSSLDNSSEPLPKQPTLYLKFPIHFEIGVQIDKFQFVLTTLLNNYFVTSMFLPFSFSYTSDPFSKKEKVSCDYRISYLVCFM